MSPVVPSNSIINCSSVFDFHWYPGAKTASTRSSDRKMSTPSAPSFTCGTFHWFITIDAKILEGLAPTPSIANWNKHVVFLFLFLVWGMFIRIAVTSYVSSSSGKVWLSLTRNEDPQTVKTSREIDPVTLAASCNSKNCSKDGLNVCTTRHDRWTCSTTAKTQQSFRVFNFLKKLHARTRSLDICNRYRVTQSLRSTW